MDLAVEESRKAKESKIDDDTAKDRLKSDQQLAAKRAGAVGSHEDVGLDREDRRIADQMIATNRHRDDEAVFKMRLAQAVTEKDIFIKERAQTDISLRAERILTDEAYAYAELLLAGERRSLNIAKDAVTTRDEFLAIVSHDLRSPLGIISMCASELAKAGAEKRLTNIETQWVDTILRYSASMSRLISDLLDVERMATGRLELARMPRDLHSLIKESVVSFQIWASKLDIKISLDADPKCNLVAYVDSNRIKQVLDNLISNAMKFTPRSGSVSIRVESNDAVVRVSVTDTGVRHQLSCRLSPRFSPS